MLFISNRPAKALVAFSFLAILCNASFSPAQNKELGRRTRPVDRQDGNNIVQIDTSIVGAETCRGRVLVKSSAPLSEAEIKAIEGKGVIVTLILEPTIYLFESTNTKKTTKEVMRDIDFILNGGVTKDTGNFNATQPDYLIRSNPLPISRVERSETADVKEPPPRAWGLEKGGARLLGSSGSKEEEEIPVAVLDYGVELKHPALKEKFWELKLKGKKFFEISIRGRKKTCLEGTRGFNFWPVSEDDICNPNIHAKTEDHGTQVAGIIGADDKDVGVARNVKLLPIRIFNSSGTGCLADAIAAWGLIIKINKHFTKVQPDTWKNIMIVNNSYGFGSGDLKGVGLDILEFAVQRTREEGLLLVTSAGDDGNDLNKTPHYPASISSENLIAVAATDNEDRLVLKCSNRGSNHGHGVVQIAAPGFGIWTTTVGDFASFNCTSAAAPFVSGGAAIIKSICSDLDYRGIKNVLINNADNIEGLETYIKNGRRINIANAVSQCRGISALLLTVYDTGYFSPPVSIIDLDKKPLIKKIS